ncbi:SDR family NAD(P)-dependent oxidoreductase [Ferrovum sp.]|uniref:SDR family NAD(P)-dependent oxidoreductase n=1 Tax=Ferrovum sp. TaxID=2609467 RepID=UPI0026323892|nr:SDR family NAD(P)-dependent oxidoreductase [Ferrovum sp.]
MKYIIVGGTSGIGLATAKMAVNAGHSVLAVGRDPNKFGAAQAIGAATGRQCRFLNFPAFSTGMRKNMQFHTAG